MWAQPYYALPVINTRLLQIESSETESVDARVERVLGVQHHRLVERVDNDRVGLVAEGQERGRALQRQGAGLYLPEGPGDERVVDLLVEEDDPVRRRLRAARLRDPVDALAPAPAAGPPLVRLQDVFDLEGREDPGGDPLVQGWTSAWYSWRAGSRRSSSAASARASAAISASMVETAPVSSVASRLCRLRTTS